MPGALPVTQTTAMKHCSNKENKSVKYVTYAVVSSVALITVNRTCQPMNLPSLASDISTSSGNSGIQTRNWMNRACRPYLTMIDADEDPRDSEPSRNTNPHDSDTFKTPHTHIPVDFVLSVKASLAL